MSVYSLSMLHIVPPVDLKLDLKLGPRMFVNWYDHSTKF